ncbi:MAG TPA: alpha/beta hydrolase [Verrucomicrobiae bacterium]|nr:alpha/beta hydrolase [Verrucomicrobiae bacterium]
MKRDFSIVSCRALLSVAAAFLLVLARAAEPQSVELWPMGAPGAKGDKDEDRPAITAYLPAPEKATGAGMIVCPGGGYMIRCTDHEGVQVARWLNDHGIAAFILRYRIVPLYTVKEAQMDARRAVQVVRTRAAEYHLQRDHIGIIGFSAGAHLAGNIAMKWEAGKPGPSEQPEAWPSRPDFFVLAYSDVGQMPGPNANANPARVGLDPAEANHIYSPTELEIASAPPTFLYCTSEDGAARGMADLYLRLRQVRVPVEAHFFAHGPHGVGFAPGDPVLGEWPNQMFAWLRANGFLARDHRVGVRGIARLDGKPLPIGCVIFSPLDSTNAPARAAYVFNRGETPGEFVLPASQGLTPGRYRVEVRQFASHWQSNSRDPVVLRIQSKLQSGQTLNEADMKEWVESARKKDFTPTQNDVVTYRHQHPNDTADHVVTIKPSEENRQDIEVFSR